MASHPHDRRPEPSFSLMRPRYLSLAGGAISAMSIAVFCSFGGINLFSAPIPLCAAIGFSIALHYLLATFCVREHQSGK